VGNALPAMFNLFDALRLLNRIPKILRHVFEETTSLDHVVRRILE